MAEYQEDLLFNGVDYSIFTVLEGIIELENLNSNLSMYLLDGETVVSTDREDFYAWIHLESLKESSIHS